MFPVFLPEFIDPDVGDNVTLSIKPKKDYIIINVDQKSKIIVLGFNRTQIPDFYVADEFELTLEDPKGLRTSSKLKINYEKRFGSPFDADDSKKKKCRAKIKKIDIFGEMTVEFNQTMNQHINVTTLNESTVDMYIVPYVEDDVSLVDRLKLGMNLTWNLTRVSENMLYFKLKFDNPVALSKESKPDEIVLHIKNLT